MFVLIPLGVIVVAVVISFFVKRHGESDRPQADWRPSDEVFNDPTTNRMMRVWLDGAGGRHYVAEQIRPSP